MLRRNADVHPEAHGPLWQRVAGLVDLPAAYRTPSVEKGAWQQPEQGYEELIAPARYHKQRVTR
jgi:hypothetical protein